MGQPTVILITGATSGLGKALALAYASEGITLCLTGRNPDRLQSVVEECNGKGAIVYAKAMDICDEATVEGWISEINNHSPIDLVIANAGISAGTGQYGEDEPQVKHIFETNVMGLMHTIHPLIPSMRKRKSGQIALISSLSAYRGLPSAPAYSASKGAVRLYGEALRGWLGKDSIKVSVVTPGYIKTPMTDVNEFPMPMMVSAERAAQIIKRGLEKNKARIAFPFPLYFMMWGLGCLSPALTDWFFAKLPVKAAEAEKE